MSYRGADPTDVMGRRIAAYLLDSLIATIIFLLLAWPVLFGSTRTAPADSFSCVDETPTVVDGHEPPSLCFQIGDTVRYVPNHKVAGFRRFGAASLDLAFVAAGRLDGYWERNLQAWDIAAGQIMVRESGGIVSGMDGNDSALTTGHVVCGNEFVHALDCGVLAP